MNGLTHLTHTIPPLYDADSRVLILGSFPSPKSRETGFYYGHPQNRFWRVLSDVLGEPFPTAVSERKDMCLRRGVALWDVIAECDICGASDASVRSAVPNDYDVILSVCDIRAIFTTGKTAEKLYERFTGRKAICLPSPSPANLAVRYETLCEAYRAVADALTEESK